MEFGIVFRSRNKDVVAVNGRTGKLWHPHGVIAVDATGEPPFAQGPGRVPVMSQPFP